MRSSKKRSRSSQNRPRTLGNIINRVFDSSGPEGKVRGTPQQIIEKYQMLARDAQLSNDRVAAENFLQHAEHYTRMLAEATREMAAEQETRQQQFQQGGGQNGNQTGSSGQFGGQTGNQNGAQSGGQQQPRADRQPDRQGDRQPDRQGERQPDRQGERQSDRGDRQERGDRRSDFPREFREDRDYATMEQPSVPDVIDLGATEETGLIDTPESADRPRHMPEAAEAAPREDRPARRARGPRKPKPEGKSDDAPPKEAAE